MNVAKSQNIKPMRTGIRIPVAWMMLIVFDVFLVAYACAQSDPSQLSSKHEVVTQLDGPTDITAEEIRFEAIDVFIDSGQAALAAYQFELRSQSTGVEIVGIEGGDHAAFASPPFYDPRAMNNNRVILAAYNTGDDLPSGRSRIARIHVQLQGPGLKEYRTRLSVSATTGGQKIPAKIEIVKAKA